MALSYYDVIVVGGGPAGVSAAKSAAKHGVKTLLIEKYPTIASNKPCGEATSQATFTTAGVPPKPNIVLRKVNAMVYAPNMNFIEIRELGFSINKSMFIQYIAAQAAEAGAHIRVGEEVQGVVRKDSTMLVKTNRGEYSSKVVIGADGYNSTVARSLGIIERSEPIFTLQYVMVNCNLDYPNSARFYLGNEVAPGGYAWIFPKDDHIAGVGIGVRRGVAKTYLDRFVKMHEKELKNAQIIDYRGAIVPIGGMIGQNVVDGAIIVGDAAGHVIPFTGAGIHSSIAAGLVAGEVAAKAVAEGDTSQKRLMEFNIKYEDPWGMRIKRSLKAMRAVEKLSDDELNLLQEILDDQDVLDLANGLNLGRVALKLLKHPILAVKLAKALM
ncbi:MAG: NAD(P)/FAD-dependent oxidoreductase [Nitrososphaerales archaeon]|nr:NAD(P)/FAD-dependent oxidoreductase [Nitrososphaerales archaeon]